MSFRCLTQRHSPYREERPHLQRYGPTGQVIDLFNTCKGGVLSALLFYLSIIACIFFIQLVSFFYIACIFFIQLVSFLYSLVPFEKYCIFALFCHVPILFIFWYMLTRYPHHYHVPIYHVSLSFLVHASFILACTKSQQN